jgi:hypothetical protein
MKRTPAGRKLVKSVSPRKETPRKETPRMRFEYRFEGKTTVEKEVSRYEVYSKIFGPPPQISKSLDQTTALQPPELLQQKLKSQVQQKKLDPPPSVLKRKDQATPAKPLRNDTFAVPSLPVPAGPPQLPPSSLPRTRKVGPLGGTEPPPSMRKSALPRPMVGRGTSSLPVPSVRRSTRGQKPGKATVVPTASLVRETVKSGHATLEKKVAGEVAIVAPPVVMNVPVVASVLEKRPLAIEPIIPSAENVTVDRRKNKLGGAQRVTRDGERVYPPLGPLTIA